jgi:small-conductance mechanosensitive channel
MTRSLWIVLLSIFFCLGLQGQEPAKPVEIVLPDPMALKGNWWDYFQVGTGELAQRITLFNAALEAKIISTSAEQQQQVTTLVKDIEQGLAAYLQTLSTPKPEPPPTKALPEQISVDAALELFRASRLLVNDIATMREDLVEKQRTGEVMGLYLDRQKLTYEGIKEPSEQKLIAGLQTIFYQIAVANARQEAIQLQAHLKVQENARTQLRSELSYALEHLFVTTEQLATSERDVETAQKNWDDAKAILAETIGQRSIGQQFSTPEATQANTALMEQETLASAIAEKQAQNRLLLAQVQLALEQLVFYGTDANADVIYDQMVKQQETINLIERQEADWQTSTQKQVQRAIQAISLIGDETAGKLTTSVFRDVLKRSHENLLSLQHLSSEIGETNFLLTQLNKELAERLGGTNLWQFVSALSSGFATLKEGIKAPLFYLGDTALTPLTILRFLAIILISVWISRYVVSIVMRIAQTRAGIRKSLVYNVNRLIRYSIFIVGVLIAFASLGMDFSSLVLILSAIGVGVGFGIQSIAANFISGIIILFEGTLRVGDYIELENGSRGEIKEINLRSSAITTNDGIDILIPNSQLLNTRVANWTLTDPFRAVCVPFTVAYGTNRTLVAEVVIEAAKKVPFTLGKPTKPDPNVHLIKLGDFGMEFQLIVWVNERATTRTRYTISDYLKAIATALEENHIAIPYPHYEVKLIEPPKDKPTNPE